ncbi:CAP domain-containing protein [Streptomyces sp. NPDC046557]|uniref:CAP domain-containing protein n=1 Tax=Streptomyces sp. NPDC046557 TaxID=3155372 RepID=UPI0033C11CA6
MPRSHPSTRWVLAIATVWLLLLAGSPFARAVTNIQPIRPGTGQTMAPNTDGATGISTVSQRNGHLDVFWVGADGSIMSNWWDSDANGAWATHQPFSITPPNSAALKSGVAAVSQRNGHLDVFWVGPDGSVRSHWWDSGANGAWATHGQFNIAPPNSAAPNSAISAVSQRDGHLDVFWVGADGSIMSNWWDSDANGAWAKHQPFSITPPNSAALNAGISSVSQRNGHLDVFWIGPDGTVRSHWWDSGANGAWSTHGQFSITPPNSAALNAGISSVSQRNGHLDVFWIGPDGTVRSHWWDSGANGAWGTHAQFNITPPDSAARNAGITAVAQRNNHLDVFWIGPDGTVRSHWWDSGANGAWGTHAQFSITPPDSAARNAGITAVAQRNNHLDVFWTGPDGTVRSHWWDSGANGAWGTHAQFNIAPPNSAVVPGGSTPPQPNPQNPPAPSEEQRFLDLINSARQRFGCAPLKADPQLTATARSHSKDLAGNPNLTATGTENRGHVGSDGSLPWDTNGGATTGRIHGDLGPSAAQAQGENVHWGKGDTFDKAMDDWMNHDEGSKWGHKYNIMGCDPDDPKNPYSNGDIARYSPPPTVNYKLVGVGIDQAADGTVYITQDFAG